MVVCWGDNCFVTYDIQTGEELLFPSKPKMPFNPISTLKLSKNNLIFLSSRNFVFVINKDLNNTGEEGLIFTLETDKFHQPCLDFFVLDAVVCKTQLPSRSSKDNFISANRLKPEGLILTVHPRQLKIRNFDDQYEKMKNSCHLETCLEFAPQTSQISMAAIGPDNQTVLLLHEDLIFVSVLLLAGAEFT